MERKASEWHRVHEQGIKTTLRDLPRRTGMQKRRRMSKTAEATWQHTFPLTTNVKLHLDTKHLCLKHHTAIANLGLWHVFSRESFRDLLFDNSRGIMHDIRQSQWGNWSGRLSSMARQQAGQHLPPVQKSCPHPRPAAPTPVPLSAPACTKFSFRDEDGCRRRPPRSRGEAERRGLAAPSSRPARRGPGPGQLPAMPPRAPRSRRAAALLTHPPSRLAAQRPGSPARPYLRAGTGVRGAGRAAPPRSRGGGSRRPRWGRGLPRRGAAAPCYCLPGIPRPPPRRAAPAPPPPPARRRRSAEGGGAAVPGRAGPGRVYKLTRNAAGPHIKGRVPRGLPSPLARAALTPPRGGAVTRRGAGPFPAPHSDPRAGGAMAGQRLRRPRQSSRAGAGSVRPWRRGAQHEVPLLRRDLQEGRQLRTAGTT